MSRKKNRAHKHEWVVFSTALQEGWLMLQCVKCGATGTVDDPSREEWSDACHAPVRPYRWDDDARVTVRHRTAPEFYVVPRRARPSCSCPSAANHAAARYERVPVEFIRSAPRLSEQEIAELDGLAAFVATSELCSLLFPVFITGFAKDTGHPQSAAVKDITDRIETSHDKGFHSSPAIVARLIREYAGLPVSPSPYRHCTVTTEAE